MSTPVVDDGDQSIQEIWNSKNYFQKNLETQPAVSNPHRVITVLYAHGYGSEAPF
jgi:hypothetical protein